MESKYYQPSIRDYYRPRPRMRGPDMRAINFALQNLPVTGQAALAAAAKNSYKHIAAGVGLAKAAYKAGFGKKSAQPKATLNTNSNTGRAIIRNSKRPRRKRKVSLRKQIKNIQKSDNSSKGVLTYRLRGTGRALAAVNVSETVETAGITISTLETILAQLRYFDPTNPGTLLTASGATGTYQRSYTFKKCFQKLTLRNNYQVPCNLSVYYVLAKSDTDIGPLTAYTNGLADEGAPSATSSVVYPTDSDQFNKLWKIKMTKKIQIQPGEEIVVSYSPPEFTYDPSLADSETASYQKRIHSGAFLIRVEGCLAHDTTADQQGLAACGVDYKLDRVFVVKYDAGVALDYLYVDTSALDAFTNGAVLSSKPVADNIGYSVA